MVAICYHWLGDWVRCLQAQSKGMLLLFHYTAIFSSVLGASAHYYLQASSGSYMCKAAISTQLHHISVSAAFRLHLLYVLIKLGL
jgi:hypothetical protein